MQDTDCKEIGTYIRLSNLYNSMGVVIIHQ